MGEVGDLRIALSPRVRVRCANKRYLRVRVDVGNTLAPHLRSSAISLVRSGSQNAKQHFRNVNHHPPSEIQRERHADLGRFGRRPALGLSRIHLLPISSGCGGMWALFLGQVALGAARLRLARLVSLAVSYDCPRVTHKYSGSPMIWATRVIPLGSG